MKRVAIIGSPGTGKTYFSRRLADKTDLPLFHLDFYFHDKKNNYENDRDAWTKRVEKMTTNDKWIIEGNYRSTFPSRFSRADTIIFLDYPRWRAVKGIYKRRIQYRNRVREEMPDSWTERIPRDFFMFVWNFNNKYRSDVLDALDTVSGTNVVIFHKPADIEQYLTNFPDVSRES